MAFIQYNYIMRRRALGTVPKLKKELWSLCREIIIQRHGSDCYTCGAKELSGSNRHLGHFIPSSVCSTEMRYDLDNLRICCYRCNIHLSGNWVAFEKHLKEDGIDPDILKRRNYKTIGRKYDILWFKARIEAYKQLLDSLKSVV